MSIVPIYVSQIMCTNFLTVANRLLVIFGRGVFSKSWSAFTRVRSNSVVTDVVWMACIWRLALIDICRFTNKGRKEKCLTLFRVFNESKSLHLETKVFFQNRGLPLCFMQILVSAHWINIMESMVYRTQSRKPSLRLSMGISDEIEDTKIAIHETKISEIEATKRRFRNYCVQTKY